MRVRIPRPRPFFMSILVDYSLGYAILPLIKDTNEKLTKGNHYAGL